MPLVTEGNYLGDVVKFEENDFYSRTTITVVSGEGKLKVGTVLGRVTASKKYVASPAALVVGKEGAETASVVLLTDIDATSADVTEVLVLNRHATVNRLKLIFEASVNDAAKRQTKVDQLETVGILAREGA